MGLLIISSILHGFSKVSEGKKFKEHPEYIKYIGIFKWLAAISLMGQAKMAMPEVARILVSMFIADFIGKGIFKIMKH